MVYTLPKFHFTIESGGDTVSFSECSGLDLETEIIEYRNGDDPSYIKQKHPGLKKWANVMLKRGMVAADNAFYEWWNTAPLNTVERRDVNISLLDEEHNAVFTWQVRQAWPTKVTSTDLKADGNEIAIETLELAHEGITVVAS